MHPATLQALPRTTPTATVPDSLLTPRQVAKRLSVSLRTLWRMTARGDVPQPIKYNRRLVRWSARVLELYMTELRDRAAGE
jgi:predicted DNA-binding transcriptional regulator AlpA